MKAMFNEDGSAGGVHSGVDNLIEQIEDLEFDALAIQTPIDCDYEVAKNYWDKGGRSINPWGAVERIVSKLIAEKINKPVAHAPIEDYNDDRLHNIYHTQIVEPQNAAEAISNTYTFCILKGLNKAPKLELDTSYRSDSILSNKDIDFLVTPHGCWGEPHKACIENNIPLVVVDENTTCYSEGFTYPEVNGIIHVENYLECAGLISCMSAGVDYKTVL